MKKLKLVAINIIYLLVLVAVILQVAQNIAYRNQSIPRGPYVSLEERARQNPDIFPHIVQDLPSGFIRLSEARNEFNDIITADFWSTGLFFRNSEGLTIATIYRKLRLYRYL